SAGNPGGGVYCSPVSQRTGQPKIVFSVSRCDTDIGVALRSCLSPRDVATTGVYRRRHGYRPHPRFDTGMGAPRWPDGTEPDDLLWRAYTQGSRSEERRVG